MLNTLTGTEGEKMIVAFNSNAESKTTVDAMPVNDAPDLYSMLSEECLRKIMLGHNVTSPLLIWNCTQVMDLAVIPMNYKTRLHYSTIW